MSENIYPRLHNASWPGIVGKGPGAEPPVSFDTMLKLTAEAEVDGVRFDGIDIGLMDPEVMGAGSDDDIKKIADKVAGYNLEIGSLVAAIWPPTGGSAMGSAEDRKRFVDEVRKACRVGKKLREMGIRPHGIIRIDSASSPEAWSADPAGNTRLIAQIPV